MTDWIEACKNCNGIGFLDGRFTPPMVFYGVLSWKPDYAIDCLECDGTGWQKVKKTKICCNSEINNEQDI